MTSALSPETARRLKNLTAQKHSMELAEFEKKKERLRKMFEARAAALGKSRLAERWLHQHHSQRTLLLKRLAAPLPFRSDRTCMHTFLSLSLRITGYIYCRSFIFTPTPQVIGYKGMR